MYAITAAIEPVRKAQICPTALKIRRYMLFPPFLAKLRNCFRAII